MDRLKPHAGHHHIEHLGEGIDRLRSRVAWVFPHLAPLAPADSRLSTGGEPVQGGTDDLADVEGGERAASYRLRRGLYRWCDESRR
jgi:hypothetical protein